MPHDRSIAAVAAPVALIVLAGFARADHTLFEYQVSPAGLEQWSSKLSVLPGASVDYRVRVSYVGNTFQPLGLGGAATFQPLVSNWTPGDVLAPFVAIGGNQNGGTVPDQPGAYGRISPWGKIATTTTDRLFGHVNTVSGTTYLRIAKRQVTSWFGGIGNTSGNSGVQAGQLSNVGRVVSDPAFNPNLTNLVVFKVRLDLDPSHLDERTMSVFSPEEWTGELNNGLRQVYWYASMSEATGSIRVPAQVIGATIHVIPTPAGVVLVAGGATVVGVRRRRACRL